MVLSVGNITIRKHICFSYKIFQYENKRPVGHILFIIYYMQQKNVNTCVTSLYKLRNIFMIWVATSQMASATGANSASDGYSRFSDDFDNIEGSYQSNNISKLNNHMLIISITLILYYYLVPWVS